MQNPKPTRAGFTLLELLIVVSIITILVSLSAVVLFGVTDSAQEQATISTIRKINALIEKRTEAFTRAFDRSGTFRNRYIDATNALLNQKNIYGVRPEVVDVLARKVAFRHMFPQRNEDLLKLGFDRNSGSIPQTAYDGDTLLATGVAGVTDDATTRGPLDDGTLTGSIAGNGILDQVDATAVAGATAAPAAGGSSDSAELLYYALVHSEDLGSGSGIAEQFSASEIGDTDNDGLLEFLDAYGEPLYFYRWPTRLMDTDVPTPFAPVLLDPIEATDIWTPGDPVTLRQITENERTAAGMLLKGLPPASVELPNGVYPRDLLFIDPDDPVGRLYSELERLDGSNNQPVFGDEFNETWYHSPETYHIPLIVSSGPDAELGLYEPHDTVNLGNLANYDLTDGFDILIDRIGDNITNRNRRVGARR